MKRFFSILLTMLILLQGVVLATDGAPGVISEKVSSILNVIMWAGYAVAFGMIIWIGAKYVMSPANDRANLKQGVVAYLIGAVLIICASSIAGIVSGVATSASGAEGIASEIINTATSF